MKTKSILFSMLIAGIAISTTSCSSDKSEANQESGDTMHATTDEAPSAAANPQFTVDKNFQQQLSSVFTSYVALKEAFVASDAGKVKTEATSTIAVLAKTDMKLLSGAAHNDWMNYLANLESSLKEIESASDIEAQRTAFSTLSDNLYKSIKAFGLGGSTAYYEYCPMAFDNQGGYWLSDENKVRNPYFGDKMLTCGSVKEELK